MSGNLWPEVLGRLEAEYPANLFQMWIRPLQAEHHVDSLELLAPNPFFVRHVIDKFLPRIREVARELSQGHVQDVRIRVGSRGDRAAVSATPASASPAQSVAAVNSVAADMTSLS